MVVTLDYAEEVKTAFDVLKEGAAVFQPIQKASYNSCCVSLIDKFGVRQEIITEQTESSRG